MIDGPLSSFDNAIPFLDFLLQIDAIDSETYQSIDKSMDDIKDYLVDQDILSRSVLESMTKIYNNTEKADLSLLEINKEALALLPEKTARRLQAVVISGESGVFKVLVKNPYDVEAIGELTERLQGHVIPLMCLSGDISYLINSHYTHSDSLIRMSANLEGEINKLHAKIGPALKVGPGGSSSYAKSILMVIFEDCFRLSASDIHLEYTDLTFIVRFRVDGDLLLFFEGQIAIAGQLFRLIKLMSKIDISIDYMPQDGALDIQLPSGVKMSARVSIIPTASGSSAVIRLFGNVKNIINIDKIVPDKDLLKHIKFFSNKKEGMMLITGPTGSGKTTTLYSILQYKNDIAQKIMTIEDPVEVMIPGICQVEINDEAKFGFADALRSALRQDPDVILVGEIRDEITANIAMRASITGHLVYSTLHTNSTIGTVARLYNLNVPGYLMADSLSLVIAQRLVKAICLRCREQEDLDGAALEKIKGFVDKDSEPLITYHGVGCQVCDGSGFKGRIPIFELLVVDSELRDFLSADDIDGFTQLAGVKIKGQKIQDKGYKLLQQGRIHLDDFLKLTKD